VNAAPHDKNLLWLSAVQYAKPVLSGVAQRASFFPSFGRCSSSVYDDKAGSS
jgi:hypothetical protein